MKTTKLALLFILLAASTYCQTETFLLGFAGNYPEGNTYTYSQNVQYGWYHELSMNTWQGYLNSDFGLTISDCFNNNLTLSFHTCLR